MPASIKGEKGEMGREKRKAYSEVKETFPTEKAAQLSRIADALERIADSFCQLEEVTTGTIKTPSGKRTALENWDCDKCAYKLLNGKPCRECVSGSNYLPRLK